MRSHARCRDAPASLARRPPRCAGGYGHPGPGAGPAHTLEPTGASATHPGPAAWLDPVALLRPGPCLGAAARLAVCCGVADGRGRPLPYHGLALAARGGAAL